MAISCGACQFTLLVRAATVEGRLVFSLTRALHNGNVVDLGRVPQNNGGFASLVDIQSLILAIALESDFFSVH